MKFPLVSLCALCLALSFLQGGCAGYYATGPAPAYYGPRYPAAGWGGAGFYGGSYYRAPYYRSGWGGSYGHANGWRGGSATWGGGYGHATGWRGGSASWHR